MVSISGLAGIIISTSTDRFPAMSRFYRDVLGLVPRSVREGFINFAWSDQRLTVAVHSEILGPVAEPARILVNLGSSDVVADFDRIAAAGATVIRRPERESWGGLVCTFADPDGTLVQLIGDATDVGD